MMTVHAWTGNRCHYVIYERNIEKDMKLYFGSISYASQRVFVLLQIVRKFI